MKQCAVHEVEDKVLELFKEKLDVVVAPEMIDLCHHIGKSGNVMVSVKNKRYKIYDESDLDSVSENITG